MLKRIPEIKFEKLKLLAGCVCPSAEFRPRRTIRQALRKRNLALDFIRSFLQADFVDEDSRRGSRTFDPGDEREVSGRTDRQSGHKRVRSPRRCWLSFLSYPGKRGMRILPESIRSTRSFGSCNEKNGICPVAVADDARPLKTLGKNRTVRI